MLLLILGLIVAVRAKRVYRILITLGSHLFTCYKCIFKMIVSCNKRLDNYMTNSFSRRVLNFSYSM